MAKSTSKGNKVSRINIYNLEKDNYNSLQDYMKKESIANHTYHRNGDTYYFMNEGHMVLNHPKKELIIIDINRKIKNDLNSVLMRGKR